jgi:hypothetical protein
MNKNGCRETDNPDIDPRIVEFAGAQIERIEHIPEENLN